MNEQEKQQISALLEEFKLLRGEINQRSTAQATLIQINIAAIGIVLGAFFSNTLDNRVLFIIPVISPMLGMLYLDHNLAIGNLGRFIQSEIKPALFQRIGAELPDYEEFVRTLELRRLERGFLLGVPIFVMFALIPLGALAAPFFLGTLKDLKEEILLFAIPGSLFVTIFSVYWLGFAWVRKARTKARARRSRGR